MDVNKAFADKFKQQREDQKPKTLLVVADSDAVISKTNETVFRVSGTRKDTGEKVFVVAQKRSANQALPKKGDAIRADKATRSGDHDGAKIFKAEYFHTYGNGLCLNAVMQPQRVRTSNNMASAQVHAFDPNDGGVVLDGSQLKSSLVAAIVEQLKPWAATSKSAVTHDVVGKGVWENGPVGGITPLAVVRFNANTFKVYGAGGLFKDKEHKELGLRFPTDAELKTQVLRNAGVQQVLQVVDNLLAQPGVTPEKLKGIDVAVLPGLAISVGRDVVLQAENRQQAYFSIPLAYSIKRDLDEPFIGYRGSFIHIKETRTGRFAAVDTVPSPGSKLTPAVPLFVAEAVRESLRSGIAPAQSSASQATPGRPLTNAEIMAAADFGGAPPATKAASAAEPAAKRAPEPTPDDAFDDDMYNMDGFADDVALIEELGVGLGDDDNLEALFNDAEAIAASRSSPRMG